jgi:phosphatidylglycerol:prolipoprotein diacylglycerol transferase
MLPKLIQIGTFYLPTYGVLVALAFLTALAIAGKLGRLQGLSRDAIMNLGIYCALAGIVGAKLFMIVLDPYYRKNPGQIFTLSTLQSAGIWYGGFIVALVFAYFYMRSQGLPFLKTSDIFAPGLAIGHAIGRLGCFAAGCCYGKPTSLPWAVTYTSQDANGAPLGVPLHPTQIYEAAIESLICVVLYQRAKRQHKEGSIIALYLILSGIARFLIEFLRAHDEANPLGLALTLEQWISVAVCLTGLFLLLRHDQTSRPQSLPSSQPVPSAQP